MVSNLGTYIEMKFTSLPQQCDLPNLFLLFLAIVQSPSLVVSIPILALCSRLLRNTAISGSDAMSPLMGPLLEICSARLLRYESLPEDDEEPSLVLLLEDIDTIPERHAFLGNYRRFCTTVVELMVRQKVSDALYYIFNQVNLGLDKLYDGLPMFTRELV